MNYKIIFMPNIGETFQFEKEFKTQEEAEKALSTIGEYTLMLNECSLMPDYSNAGMVFAKDGDGEWIEI